MPPDHQRFANASAPASGRINPLEQARFCRRACLAPRGDAASAACPSGKRAARFWRTAPVVKARLICVAADANSSIVASVTVRKPSSVPPRANGPTGGIDRWASPDISTTRPRCAGTDMASSKSALQAASQRHRHHPGQTGAKPLQCSRCDNRSPRSAAVLGTQAALGSDPAVTTCAVGFGKPAAVPTLPSPPLTNTVSPDCSLARSRRSRPLLRPNAARPRRHGSTPEVEVQPPLVDRQQLSECPLAAVASVGPNAIA